MLGLFHGVPYLCSSSIQKHMIMFAKETYVTRCNSLKRSVGTGLLLFLRNEEDYLITEDGARLLGKKIPFTTEEVEELR